MATKSETNFVGLKNSRGAQDRTSNIAVTYMSARSMQPALTPSCG